MLRSVYTKSLRDMRWGVLGWGVGFGALAAATAVGWAIAYPDAASRAQLAAQINGGLSVAQTFYGPPHDIDKLGGFVEWRALGLAPVLLGLYLILAATGMTRGAEESRIMEVIAATPMTRTRVLIEQTAAIATAITITVAIMAGITMAAALASGEGALSPARVAGTYANVAAGALIFGALGLVAAQVFASRRTAALASTGMMVLAHLANTLPLVVPDLRGIRYASPLYLYTRSSPLANGHLDWPAFGALLLVSVALAAMALLASQRRDLFDVVRFGRGEVPAPDATARAVVRAGPASPDVFLRNSLGRGLRDAFAATAAWAIGLSLFAVLMTALVPNMRVALLEQPNSFLIKSLVTEKALLSALLFSLLLPAFITVFGVTLAGAWAGDELSQRLELELAAPVARWTVFVERLVAAVGSTAIALAVIAIAVMTTIELLSLDVPTAALAAATFALLVLTACVVAVAFAIGSWKPQLAAAAAGAFVAISFFANLLIPLFDLPFWVRYFSVFGLYGAPLADGVSYWRLSVLALVGIICATAGSVSFQRRDIAK